MNPFTATGRIYTSQKRPSRWPRTYISVQPQFRFYVFVKARPPTWLLLHVSEVSSSSVRWSLLALLGLFIEKTVLLCFTRFLSKWRETALWMFPDATQAGTSCMFDGFNDDGDWGESWFRLVESEGDEWRWRLAWRGNWWRGRLGKKMTTLLLWTKTLMFKLTVNARLAIAFVEGSSVRMYEHRREWHCESAVKRTSKQEHCVKTLVK